MASGTITVSKLNSLQGWLWDDRVIGLGVRKQVKGCFYYLRVRHNGSQMMRSIGRHGSPWTPDTARNEARRLLGTLATGTNPFAETLSAETFGHEVDRYLERKRALLKPRTFVGVEHHLRQQSAPLASLKLAEIDRRTVASLLAKVETDSGPIARNRLRSTLSAFFNFAIAEGIVGDDWRNPVQGTLRVDEGGSRERVLSADELKMLWRSLGDDSFGNIIRLLLLTGCRRDEIGKLTWLEVNLAKREINLPAERCKNGRAHTVPLSTQAVAILERILRRNSSAYLFSDVSGFNDWYRAKQILDGRIGIAEWTLHDLRRTCATNLGELGVRSEVIEECLNHRSGHKRGVAGRYNWAKYADEMRMALTKWADYIDQITA
jgi:integrase